MTEPYKPQGNAAGAAYCSGRRQKESLGRCGRYVSFLYRSERLFAWSYLNDLLEQMSPASLRREEFPHGLPEQMASIYRIKPPVSPILRAENDARTPRNRKGCATLHHSRHQTTGIAFAPIKPAIGIAG
jgi:hypothetical protein